MLSGSRPSPTTVLAVIAAVIALVFAIVGSAVAGTDGLSSKITKSKLKAIAKKQIKAAAPGLSVARATYPTGELQLFCDGGGICTVGIDGLSFKPG